MKDSLPRFTLRVPQVLLDKLGYIAEYEGRTKNRELEQMIRRRIADFESQHGQIRLDEPPV
nr:Arc family DNA-binding protein [uncultured Dysosmobacter sp.]